MATDPTSELIAAAVERGVAARLKVYGRSMVPALVDGEAIEVHPLARAPRPGEVVAWVRAGALVVHRVRRLHGGGRVQTQGDARGEPDSAVRRDEILGRVTLPGGRSVAGLGLRVRARRRLRAWLGR